MRHLAPASFSVLLFTLILTASPSAAQWRRISLPEEDAPVVVTALASPAPGIVLAADFLGRLYRQQAEGAWQAVLAPFAAADGLEAGAGSGYLLRRAEGLWHSSDAGQTWTLRQMPALTRVLWAEGPRVLGYTPEGLARSDDGGATWHALPRPVYADTVGSDVEDVPLEPHDALLMGDTWLIAAAPVSFGLGLETGVFRWREGEPRWTFTGLSGPFSSIVSFQGRVFVAGEEGVFHSGDAGQTFRPAGIGLPAPTPAAFPGTLYTDGTELYLHHGGPQFYVWKNERWVALPALNTARAQVVATVRSGRLVTSSANGSFTWYGTLWAKTVPPLRPPEARVVEVNGAVLAGGAEGLYRLREGDGETWWTALTPGNAQYGVDGVPGLLTAQRGLKISTDGGRSWQEPEWGVVPPWGGSPIVPRALLPVPHAGGAALYAAYGTVASGIGGNHGEARTTFGTVRRSMDAGQTWTALDAGLPAGVGGRAVVFSLYRFGSRVLAYTLGSGSGPACAVLGADDVWQPAACPPSGAAATTFVWDGLWFYRGDAEVVASADEGRTWMAVRAGLPGATPSAPSQPFWQRARLAYTAQGPLLLAPEADAPAVPYRLYRYSEGTWQAAGPAPPGVYWTNLVATPTTLYAATHGDGLWSLPLAAVTGTDAPAPLHTAGLSLAGPNPFRDRTTVRVDGSTPVRLGLYDVLGRCVRRYDALPGPFEIDAAGLSPGLYALRVEGKRANGLLITVAS